MSLSLSVFVSVSEREGVHACGPAKEDATARGFAALACCPIGAARSAGRALRGSRPGAESHKDPFSRPYVLTGSRLGADSRDNVLECPDLWCTKEREGEGEGGREDVQTNRRLLSNPPIYNIFIISET